MHAEQWFGCGIHHIVTPNLDFSTSRHRMFGIKDNILNNLTDLATINIAHPESFLEGIFAGNLGAMQDKLGGFVNKVGEGGCFPDRLTTFGKRQELLRELCRSFGRFLSF
jgi:hypothetical protein